MGRVRDGFRRLAESRAVTTLLVLALLLAGVGAAMVAGDGDEGRLPVAATPPADTRNAETLTTEDRARSETRADPLPPKETKRRVPRRFRVSTESVRRLFERDLGARVRGGERRLIDLRCSGGRCLARYYASQKGQGRVFDDLESIFRTLLRDPRFRGIDVFVHHEVVGRFKDERLAFIELRCDRSAARALVRGDDSRCRSVFRSGQDREAPHAKDGGPPAGRAPPAGRRPNPPDG